MAAQRQVMKSSLILTMHPRRHRAAAGTVRVRAGRARLERHALGVSVDLYDRYTVQVWQQGIDTRKIAPRSDTISTTDGRTRAHHKIADRAILTCPLATPEGRVVRDHPRVRGEH
jgi:hypothetical protein